MIAALFDQPPGRPAFMAQALDRAAIVRKSPERLANALADPRCRLLVSWRDLHLMTPDRQALVMTAADDPLVQGAALIFLGLMNGAPVFAAYLPFSAGDETPPDTAGAWENLRTVGLLAPADVAGMAATAQGLFHWHQRHGFCGVCGHPTHSEDGGYMRMCGNPTCATPHFPRTDPAVIMLVCDGQDRILLGRQAAWPVGMISTLAGFVEPGETLEQAVAREVHEEVGLVVDNIRYFASQPWPFPSSLMVGFFAHAVDTDIRLDQDELETARWFTRAELTSFRDSIAVEGTGFAFPSPISISRALINHWLLGR